MYNNVLVIGATGFLGGEVCNRLLTAGKKVTALVRSGSDTARVRGLQAIGIETIEGDLKDFNTLQNAFSNAEAVISTASSTLSRTAGDSIETVDLQGQLNAVAAAKQAGVKHFVYISFLESPESFPLQDAKRAVEAPLQNSGMSYTILRPTFFTEIWLSPNLGFDIANNKATVYGNGDKKISWISVKDVAAFAAASVDQPVAKNKVIDLGGAEALSPAEVIGLFEQASGKKFEVQYVPEDAIRMQHQQAADSLQKSFSGLMLTYAGGAEVPMKETLEQFRLPVSSVRDYSKQVLQAPA